MKIVIRGVLVFVSLLITVACSQSIPEFKSTDISKTAWDPDFNLVSHTNQPISLPQFKNRVVAIFFGYSQCPHICSPTLARLAKVREALGPVADELQVLFITVDPEYDTPKQLAEFLPKFDGTFIGVTGTKAQIQQTTKNYKLYTEKQPDQDNKRIIFHPGAIFIIDKNGKLKLYMKDDLSINDMVHDIKIVIAN